MDDDELQRVIDELRTEIANLKRGDAGGGSWVPGSEGGDWLGEYPARGSDRLGATELLSRLASGEGGRLAPLLTALASKGQANEQLLEAISSLGPGMERAAGKLRAILPVVSLLQQRRGGASRSTRPTAGPASMSAVTPPARRRGRPRDDWGPAEQEYAVWSIVPWHR